MQKQHEKHHRKHRQKKKSSRYPGQKYYPSPRWSQEIYDCSMPMTLDQYNLCGFACLYCFSQYRRAIGNTRETWEKRNIRHVDIARIVRIFTEAPKGSQFGVFVQQRKVLQWGGLSDPFCNIEKKYGIGLELLQFFKTIEYPISFSTKGTWWLDDSRYVEFFQGTDYWNVKFSIISSDAALSRRIECGVPSPQEWLNAIEKYSKLNNGGATLRLRPFILGMSEKTCVQLIKDAANAGATALSTEFFCLDTRVQEGVRKNYQRMSDLLGYDMVTFYKKYSAGSGYLRLNRNVKRQYVDMMEDACKDAGLRFYISDAHFKERCCNGSCCGLPESWGYSRGQDTEALTIARRKGFVQWKDIAWDLEYAKEFKWRVAQEYNTRNSEAEAKFFWHTMFDFLHDTWNNPKAGQSPFKMFGGILLPDGRDEEGDIIYRYNAEKA